MEDSGRIQLIIAIANIRAAPLHVQHSPKHSTYFIDTTFNILCIVAIFILTLYI